MGVVLSYAFLRHLSKVLDFHGKNLVTCHLAFAVKIRHRFALGNINCDNHIGRDEQVYIYIHHAQCKHIEQESKCLHA